MTFAVIDHLMPRRRGFSLIEVLLAVAILGIGVISIAALFPAGIAQQRQSVDDVLGPTIANNAMSILRTKLSQKDFGTFEEFSAGALVQAPLDTVDGDWPWVRPAVVFDDDPTTPYDERGAIDIFSFAASQTSLTTATEFPLERAIITKAIGGSPI